ncbi:carbohydrate ABC transporter permease [Jiangella alkaliphila]|uniref:Carbohydrate ABC transporter membrane protein 1, CUT1 family n=1 Tax=Jiangella alkaliphila TaxID=419479 RepID=A0A1H2L3Z0_9ACTN|nr:sugar ABC transporter permease [Jiangella alkaliphila]SDU75445.1 carbohydrate ABC transporter membrane protein 1, CUT1 family [Jiangella alkaliphila]
MTTLVQAPPGAPGPARETARRSRHRDTPMVLALPAFLWYLVFLVGPLASVFVVSLTNATTLIAPREFVGLENFQTMFADDVFWTAVRNTAVQIGVVVPVMVVLGFMLGYYLFLRPPLAGLLRILFFTSALLSVATKAMVFYAILAPDGLVNQGLDAIGLDTLARNWLADPSTTLPVIMAVDLWSGVGFLAVLFGAQLTALPSDVIEASRIDGCGHWRSMWHVAFGMIRGFVGIVAMLQFLWTLFLSAATVLLLTSGGPGTSSVTLSYLVYVKAFQQSDIGYSQAVGVVLFVAGLAGAVAIRSALRSRV